MATFKKEDSSSELDSGDERDSEAEVRRELRIETLADDEELIGDSMFSELHADLVQEVRGGALKARSAASAHATRRPKDSPAVAPGESAPSVPQRPADGPPELDELLLVEVATELPPDTATDASVARRAGPCAAAPTSLAEVAGLEARIRRAADRDEVARFALQLARRYAEVVALLVVNQGIIAGLRGEGEDLAQRIEGVMISQSVDSTFARVANSGVSECCHAPFPGMDARVLGALGRKEVQQTLVAPVAIRGRVVNLLYADNCSGQLPTTSIAALEALCACVAEAYTRLIVERKRQP